MLEPILNKNNNVKTLNSALKNTYLDNLSLLERQMLAYFTAKIGYCTVPRLVPALYIGLKLRLSRQQVRTVLNKLIKKGLLERWTTHKAPDNKYYSKQKFSYFRLPYPNQPSLFAGSRTSANRKNQLIK